MKKNILLLGFAAFFTACTSFQPALSTSDSLALEAYPVKGRQGFLINQKLKFGDFETSKVKRSWTREGNTRVDLLSGQVHNPAYPNLISMDYVDKGQTFFFQMQDEQNNFSDVYGASEFHSGDLQLGDNPNTVVNILEDIFGKNNYSDNLFYLQLFLNDNQMPWQLVLDNDAAHLKAEDYRGVFALDEENYYTLQPVTKVQSKKGPQEVWMGSSLGYEVFNPRNESVAAVSLIDNGTVYLHTKDPKERFLMANLLAALLLQGNLNSL